MIRNFTPHDIDIYDVQDCCVGDFGKMYLKENVKPIRTFHSEGCIRVTLEETSAGTLEGIPLMRIQVGRPQDLPEIVPGDVYIVSLATIRSIKEYYPELASQFVSVMGMVWDSKGKSIGCTAFSL